MAATAQYALSWLASFAAIYLAVVFAAHVMVLSLGPARLQAALGGAPWRSTVAALGLGALTPFCTCSTVPLVAGMHAAGVPPLATTAFLIISPIVNPATVALLATLAGVPLAVGFVLLAGLLAVVVAGALALVRVRPRPHDGAVGCVAAEEGGTLPWPGRIGRAVKAARRDLGRLTPVLVAVAVLGAALHGRVDVDVIGRSLEAAGPLAVPLAVLVGVPVYASTAVLLPLGGALLTGGASLGVVSAFLIGATGLSLPEGVLLYRLLGGRYLRALVAAFVLATVALGYLVDALTAATVPELLAGGQP